jgi:hypothetical protein
MRFGFLLHLILFLVVNAALAILNLAPVGFDVTRPGVPLWFVYPTAIWGVALLVHAGVALSGRRAPVGPTPAPARVGRAAPAEAGQAGALLAGCRQQAGSILAAVGARGPVPVDLDDLLRGGVDQAERLAEHLGAIYQRRLSGDVSAAAEVTRFEGLVEGIERALKVLALEAQVLAEGADPMGALAAPLEALREAILCACETLAE